MSPFLLPARVVVTIWGQRCKYWIHVDGSFRSMQKEFKHRYARITPPVNARLVFFLIAA
ncbi:MAG: hypothetical protein VX768_07300 [Planctomycetota bacterium]|nr:hypothetical protein [Planctomycetota bacterium]